MGIWSYNNISSLISFETVVSERCIYCSGKMIRVPAQYLKHNTTNEQVRNQLSLCPVCGWWSVYRIIHNRFPETEEIEGYAGAIGSLKELDLADISIPLCEIRSYIAAKPESRFDVNPKLFEDIVSSIFSDFGWITRVTAYRGDGGIDIVLDGKGSQTIGVQVKRYKRAIEAEQIRAFAGALLVNGYTRGVYVTTSNFRRGAKKTSECLQVRGYPIELVDAIKFLNALGIAQMETFKLSKEQIEKLLKVRCGHLGGGLKKPFENDDEVFRRFPAARIFSLTEMKGGVIK